jgi:hypothetical protein
MYSMGNMIVDVVLEEQDTLPSIEKFLLPMPTPHDKDVVHPYSVFDNRAVQWLRTESH